MDFSIIGIQYSSRTKMSALSEDNCLSCGLSTCPVKVTPDDEKWLGGHGQDNASVYRDHAIRCAAAKAAAAAAAATPVPATSVTCTHCTNK